MTAAILDTFRKRGIRLRRTPAWKLEVSGETLQEDLREEIRAHRAEIMAALEEEALQAVSRSEEKATAIIRESQRRPKHALVTEEAGELVFLTCRRRDGGGWTISIPRKVRPLQAGDGAGERAGEDPLR
jgi:hypothetical protein